MGYPSGVPQWRASYTGKPKFTRLAGWGTPLASVVGMGYPIGEIVVGMGYPIGEIVHPTATLF